MRQTTNKYLFYTWVIVGLMFLSGCDKDEDDSLAREYLDSGSIEFNISGRINSNSFQINNTYCLLNDYYESACIYPYSHLAITRYSSDMQSFIEFYIPMDENNQYLDSGYSKFSFRFYYVDENTHEYLIIEDSYGSDSLGIMSFSYDMSKGVASGEFSYKEKSSEKELSLSGSFDVKVYKFYML